MIGNYRRATPNLITGVLITIVGVALLLDHMGIVPGHLIFRLWPLLLIFGGLVRVFRGCGASGRLWGGFLIFVGILIQLHEFDMVPFGIHDIWPLFLIALGGVLIIRSLEGRSPWRYSAAESPIKQSDQPDHTAIFSGFKQRTSGDFKGGTLTAVFGGFELDLRSANIPGSEAVIDTTAVFGGGEIRIPEQWELSIQGVAIFGGYSDETHHPPQDAATPPKRLIVKGIALFGGVSIKN